MKRIELFKKDYAHVMTKKKKKKRYSFRLSTTNDKPSKYSIGMIRLSLYLILRLPNPMEIFRIQP
jgi:hypothetical protein